MKVQIDYLILLFLFGVFMPSIKGWESYGKFAMTVAGGWVVLEIVKKVWQDTRKKKEES
jgi:hypothetical protein